MAGMPLGSTLDLDGDTVVARVFRSGDPERIDDYADAPARWPSGCARSASGRRSPRRSSSAAGCGACWSPRRRATERLPAGSERRLLDFAELVAQALANADAYEKLAELARPHRRGRRRRAAAPGAQPARRRPAAARVARAPAAHGRGQLEGNPDARSPGSRRGARAAQARARRAARARPRHPSGRAHRPRAGRALSALAHRAPRAGGDRRRARRAPARAGRGGRLLPHRRGDHQRRQVRPGDARRGERAPRRRSRPRARSPTTASAAPTPAPARACAASPTASRRSTGTCASTARPVAARAWRRASPSSERDRGAGA